MNRRSWVAFLLPAVAALTVQLQAQHGPIGVKGGLARLTLVEPTVWVVRAGGSEKVIGVPEMRLHQGDTISTGDEARAEIRFDPGVHLRLDERAEATITEMTASRARVQLLSGLAQVIRNPGESVEIQIETGAVIFLPGPAGVYRVEAGPDGGCEFTVRSGKADVIAPAGRVTVKKKNRILVRGIHDPEFIILKAVPPDEWDWWNWERNIELFTADPGDWCRSPR